GDAAGDALVQVRGRQSPRASERRRPEDLRRHLACGRSGRKSSRACAAAARAGGARPGARTDAGLRLLAARRGLSGAEMGTPTRRTLAHAGRSLIGGATLVLCLIAAGCGSAGRATSTARNPAAAGSANPVAVSASVPRQLRILSPATGAHTGAAVTVRVHV